MTDFSDRVSSVVFRDAGAASISGSERFHVLKEGYEDQFRIDIALPAMPAAHGKKLPVIYVLDGAWTFPLTAQTARALSIGAEAIPQAVVVGIGPALDGGCAFGMTTARRYRDLAPGIDEPHIAQMRQLLPEAYWPPGDDLGGAARFLRFIEEEVKPFVETYFPVDTTDQTLIGVSLGGLFVLNALFASPGSFQRYIAISPSIWWNDRAVLKAEETSAKLGGTSGRLFMGVGEQEEAQAPEAKMVSNVIELSKKLRARNHAGLSVASHVFEGEGHMSVPPAGISRGLRAVFAA